MKRPFHCTIVTEDALSEEVVLRLLEHSGVRCDSASKLGREGFGYIRSSLRKLNQVASVHPVLALTDLDRTLACPRELIARWFDFPRNPGFTFRVVVRAIESWLLADRNAFARFAGIAVERVPCDVETLPDPKATLIDLVRSSRNRGLRDGIVPRAGSSHKVGRTYNPELIGFVRRGWDPGRAAGNSLSLEKAIRAVRGIA